jgi:hypothetical protein
MRRLLLSLALGLVALGVLATTPGSAKAYLPVRFAGPRPASGNGNVNIFAPPTVRVQSNGSGVTKTNSSPGGHRAVVAPPDATRLWYGSSFTTSNCNSSAGSAMQSSNSSVMGSVISPYAGFRSVNQPSLANVSNGHAHDLYARYLGANSLGLVSNSNAGTGAKMAISVRQFNGSHAPLSAGQFFGFHLPQTADQLFGSQLPLSSGQFLGSQLPLSSGKFLGSHLPLSPGQFFGSHVSMSSGLFFGFHLPLSAGHFYGFHLPTDMSLPSPWDQAYRSIVEFAINL